MFPSGAGRCRALKPLEKGLGMPEGGRSPLRFPRSGGCADYGLSSQAAGWTMAPCCASMASETTKIERMSS